MSYSQPIDCDSEIKLKFGALIDDDCFSYRIPVWFEYTGSGTPSFFSLCYHRTQDEEEINPSGNIDILGDVVNARVEGVIINLASSSFMGDELYLNRSFKISTMATDDNEEVDVPFGTEATPNFYILITADPDETVLLENVRFLNGIQAGDGCNSNTDNCSPPIVFPSNSNEFTTSNTNIGDCNVFGLADKELQYFIATNEVVYEQTTNTATFPVKVRSLDPTFGNQSVNLANMTFDIVWDDLYENLEVGVNSNSESNTSIISGEFSKTVTNDKIELDVFPSGGTFFTIPLTNGEAEIFRIKVTAPNNPVSAADVTFNFENSVVLPVDNAGDPIFCCSIPGEADASYSFAGNEMCFEGDYGLLINTIPSANICEIPDIMVELIGIANSAVIYNMNIEMNLSMTGTLAIDEVATRASANSSLLNPSNFIITPNKIEIQYSGFWSPDFSQQDPLSMFDIHFTGDGMLTQFQLKHADFVYGDPSNPPCVVESTNSVDTDNSFCSAYNGQIQMIESENEFPGDVCSYENSTTCSGTCTPLTVTNKTFSKNCNANVSLAFGLGSINEPANCGVSTFDIVLISKHILGIQPFDAPEDKWKQFAADVNESNSVTTLDIIQIRKLILGLNVDFGTHPAWKLVPCDFDWSIFDLATPSTHPDGCISPPGNDMCNICFDVIKMGDVNASCNSPSGNNPEDKPEDIIYIDLIDKGFNSEGKYEVGFDPQSFSNIVGFQMAIEPGAPILSYHDSKEEDLVVSKEGFYDQSDVTRVVWLDFTGTGKTLTQSKEMFGLDYTVNLPSNNYLNGFQLRNDILPARAYRFDGKVLEIKLAQGGVKARGIPDIDHPTKEVVDLEAYKMGTDLKITSGNTQKISLNIYNTQGRSMLYKSMNVQKGTNTIPIDDRNWVSGVYFISIQTKQGLISTKWVKN